MQTEATEAIGGTGMGDRRFLPMSTGGALVPPGVLVTIAGRPHRAAFLPDRLFVSKGLPESWWRRLLFGGTSAGDFVIHDVRIGTRSVLRRPGPIPADQFNGLGAVNLFVCWESVPVGVDLSIVVEYIGRRRKGLPFYGAVIGVARSA